MVDHGEEACHCASPSNLGKKDFFYKGISHGLVGAHEPAWAYGRVGAHGLVGAYGPIGVHGPVGAHELVGVHRPIVMYIRALFHGHPYSRKQKKLQ